jgi:hypothetical protein
MELVHVHNIAILDRDGKHRRDTLLLGYPDRIYSQLNSTFYGVSQAAQTCVEILRNRHVT